MKVLYFFDDVFLDKYYFSTEQERDDVAGGFDTLSKGVMNVEDEEYENLLIVTENKISEIDTYDFNFNSDSDLYATRYFSWESDIDEEME